MWKSIHASPSARAIKTSTYLKGQLKNWLPLTSITNANQKQGLTR